MSVAQQITTVVKGIPKGVPFTPREFFRLGSRNNIDKVLERLVKEGEVKRLLRGVYVCPEFSQYIGEVTPSVDEIIKAIAGSTGEILQLHGAECARQIGLSTQAPVKPIYLTSGQSRTIMIEKIEVKFIHASSKKLILVGTQAGLALAALWYLGKRLVTIETITKIKRRIKSREFETLLENKNNMPSWMAMVFLEYEKQNE